MKLFPVLVAACHGHGRMVEPPGRSSLKYFIDDPFVAPFKDQIVPNYNDNQLFCGGFTTQVNNGYKCGVCGDDYREARPRSNELGGKFGKSGIIPRSYESGSTIPVTIQITAHHQGYFQFKLCKIEKGETAENEACFDSDDSILELYNGAQTYSIKNSFPEPKTGQSGWIYKMAVKLPQGLECDHCVMQWRYHTGNSWGTDDSGHSGIGVGYQEEFYGCADVEILATGAAPSTPGPTTRPTTQATQTQTSASTGTMTTPTTTKSTTATTPRPTFPPVDPPNTVSFCFHKPDGLYSNPFDCAKFYQCVGGMSFEVICPPGLLFNSDQMYCDWPQNVIC